MPPNDKTGPAGGTGPAPNTLAGASSVAFSLEQPTDITVNIPGQRSFITIDIDHFRARILQDALTEATAQYWVHRGYQFQQAAPRLGEFQGNATREELNEAWTRCHATAAACRAHADLISGEYPEEMSDEVWAVLGEVA